jgi:hypothetical protein
MIRKQIYLEKRQQDAIRKMAAVHGVSEAEIIRQAIDAQRGQPPRNSHLDTSAWERALKLMRSMRPIKTGGKSVRAKKWNREELYEDRMKRYGRHTR